MAEQTIASWSPEDVISSGKQLILSSNYEKVGDARKQIDETIFKWVEFLEEFTSSNASNASNSSSTAALVALANEKIVTAWTQYAELEIELRQFKQATKVFESAVSCPVASKNCGTWLRYAQFCMDRKKHSNARKVFVRAITALEDHGQEDLTDMWQRFLAFVQAQFDPNMTLPTLQQQIFPEKILNGTTTTEPKEDQPRVTPLTTATSDLAPTSSSISTSSSDKHPPVASTTTTTTTTTTAASPAAATASVPLTATSVAASPTAAATKAPQAAKAAATVKTATLQQQLDPSIAFVDTTGDSLNASTKRSADADNDDDRTGNAVSKRAKTEQDADADADATYFVRLPMHLPVIPGCPHLLFDALAQGEHQREIANDLVEKLSDVLGDSAVFEGVTNLRDLQRKKDRDMLYRWQELVATQMKEGCELFQRHVELEKNASDTRQLIELKSQHLSQRHEFVNRCQMSQQQFVEISQMDRVNALEAQQISMENLKVPEMKVSKDEDVVALQRAIVGLILEAEKIWREENSKTAMAATSVVLPAPVPTPVVPAAAATAAPAICEPARPSREAYVPQEMMARGGTSHNRLDGNDSTHARIGGFRDTPPRRGGGGSGRRGPGGGNSRRSPPPYSGGAPARASAMAKRDVEAYSPVHIAGAPMHTQAYDPRQQQPSQLQLQQPPQQQQPPLVHTSFQQPPPMQQQQMQQPQYEEYVPAYAEEYDPEYSAVYDPQQHAMTTRPPVGVLRNQAQAPAPWRNNNSNINANAPPMADYNNTSAPPPQRYGGRQSQGGGGPSQRRASPKPAFGSGGGGGGGYGNSGKYAGNAPPPGRRGGMGPSRYGSGTANAPGGGHTGGYNDRQQYGDYNYPPDEQQAVAAGGFGGAPYRPVSTIPPQASPYQPQQQQMHPPLQRTGRVTGGPGGYRGGGSFHGGGRRGGYRR